MRDEVPHVKRPPSEYIREHFWVSTQPMEEAEEPEHVIDAMRWIGFDRILFASDYPHWDFDDPVLALPPSLTDEQRAHDLCGQRQEALRACLDQRATASILDSPNRIAVCPMRSGQALNGASRRCPGR